MRKLLPAILLLLLIPSLGLSQGLHVSSISGKVEILRPASSTTFQPLTASSPLVQIGDRIRTSAESSVVLTTQDSSYFVVTQNTELVVRDFSSNGVRNTVNVLLGRVKFFVEKLGGRPNPYRVETPTALIAVRGTVFDVVVDNALYTEVICEEGQVVVEAIGIPNREVIVNPGFHTLVVPGQPPMTPVGSQAALLPNRTIKIQKKGPEDPAREISPRSLEQFLRDNDKMSRPSDAKGGGSQTDPNVGRAKPTLNYPE